MTVIQSRLVDHGDDHGGQGDGHHDHDDDYSDYVDYDRHGDHDSLISLHNPPGAQGHPLGMQSLLQEDPPGQPLSPPCPYPQRHGP